MEIRFADHTKFHRAAAGMVGASALLGLALHPVTELAPVFAGLSGIALGATFAHGRPLWRLVPAALGCATIAALARADLATSTLAPILAALAIAFGVGLAAGVRGVRGVIALAVGAVIPLAAIWVALRFDHAQQLHAWPAWLVAPIAATAMAIVGVLAMLPRHLGFEVDPVATAVRRLPASLAPEVRELCDRGLTIWTAARRDLHDDGGLQLVRDGVVNTLAVAMKTAQVNATGPGDAEIATRIADLDGRIAAASDAEVKTQYESARAALADQQRYRDRIRTGRERLIARMHNHVAALEKFHLAATTLPAARAEAATAQLEELSHEVAASGEAMAELDVG
jgi:hypothetical protein